MANWSWDDVVHEEPPQDPEVDEKQNAIDFLRRRADEMVKAAIREKGTRRHPLVDQAERTAAAYRQAAIELSET